MRLYKKLLSANSAEWRVCELPSPINWWFVSINFQFMRNLALWFDGGANLRGAQLYLWDCTREYHHILVKEHWW
jgi:hypothetical protein